MTDSLLKFIEDPSAGKLTSVGVGALGDHQGGFQNRKPFRPLVFQSSDCSKRFPLVHAEFACLD